MTGSFFIFLSLIMPMSILSLFGGSKKSDPDEAVLAQLKKAGSDLSKPHQIEFFLYFHAESSAQQAAKQIKEQGFNVEVRRAAKGTDWLCFATKKMVPELAALQRIRRDFSNLAAANGGEYDGWGTGVVQ
jgi:regulator of RNase E activity RraB